MATKQVLTTVFNTIIFDINKVEKSFIENIIKNLNEDELYDYKCEHPKLTLDHCNLLEYIVHTVVTSDKKANYNNVVTILNELNSTLECSLYCSALFVIYHAFNGGRSAEISQFIVNNILKKDNIKPLSLCKSLSDFFVKEFMNWMKYGSTSYRYLEFKNVILEYRFLEYYGYANLYNAICYYLLTDVIYDKEHLIDRIKEMSNHFLVNYKNYSYIITEEELNNIKDIYTNYKGDSLQNNYVLNTFVKEFVKIRRIKFPVNMNYGKLIRDFCYTVDGKGNDNFVNLFLNDDLIREHDEKVMYTNDISLRVIGVRDSVENTIHSILRNKFITIEQYKSFVGEFAFTILAKRRYLNYEIVPLDPAYLDPRQIITNVVNFWDWIKSKESWITVEKINTLLEEIFTVWSPKQRREAYKILYSRNAEYQTHLYYQFLIQFIINLKDKTLFKPNTYYNKLHIFQLCHSNEYMAKVAKAYPEANTNIIVYNDFTVEEKIKEYYTKLEKEVKETNTNTKSKSLGNICVGFQCCAPLNSYDP